MSAWSLSLTDLANQAEAFLEQVDKKAAKSLQEDEESENEEGEEEEEVGEETANIFSALNNTVSILPDADEFSGSEESHSSPEYVSVPQDVVSISDGSEDSKSEVLSRLELENKLIKQEVSQLTEEISFLSSKLSSCKEKLQVQSSANKEQQEELKRQSGSIRRLKENEADLKEALTAKDTQIGVLKVRLAEADSELLAQNAHLKTIQEELNVSSSCYRELNELRDELKQCNSKEFLYKQTQNELQEEKRKMEEDLQEQITIVTNTLYTSQQQLSAERRKYNSAVSELRLAQNELEVARNDLSAYKERATRVLQSKEKKTTETGILDEEGVEVLIQERNLLENDLRSARSELQIVREHLNSTELLHNEELQQALEHSSTTQSTLKDKERELAACQDKIYNLQQEVDAALRETANLRSSSTEEARALRAELQAERTRRANNGVVSSPELEVKIKSLTEVLLTKQSEVERLSSEKSSLVLRLESLETVLQSVELKNNAVSVPVEREGFVGQKTEHRSERVRDALNSIDKFSVRLGVFLRRYPHARLMVLGYMVLLHSWVMVVLLTYTPEIHDTHNIT
ncbi:hypothetical protein ACHWQZ_G000450 [Mnemiopsis leidyi]